MEIKIPQALVEDHKEMNARLQQAGAVGGKVGEAVQALSAVMAPHVEREEKYALPPLGLLPALTRSELDYDMGEATVLTDTLRDEMPAMMAEHRAIRSAVDALEAAAKQEGKLQILDLVGQIRLHLIEEEQVYYPAAELIGLYLKVKLAPMFNPYIP
jgi:hypothetical protein